MKIKLRTAVLGTAVLIACCANSFAAPTCKLIQFDDIKPVGFNLDQCWSGIGMDHNQNVYIGISHVYTMGGYNAKDDVAIFRYDAKTGQRKFLNTLKGIATANGNLGPNSSWPAQESMAKIHCPILEYNGKMYFSSHDYHGLKTDYSDTLLHRGGHFFSYDLATGQFGDLSKNEPYGVSVRYQTLVTMNVLRAHNKLAGYTFPWGDIVTYDLAQNKTSVYRAPAEFRRFGNLCSREIITTRKGKVFFTYVGANAPLWELDISTGVVKKTAFTLKTGFVNGMAETRDGRFVYFNNMDGTMYAFNTETETLEYLGSCAPDDQIAQGYQPHYLLSFSMSRDETKLYSLVPAWTTTQGIPYSLYEYDIPTRKKRYLGNFNDVLKGSTITGNGVTDSLGRIYFARLNGGISCGLIQITLDPTSSTIRYAVAPNPRSPAYQVGSDWASIMDVFGRTLWAGQNGQLGTGNVLTSQSASNSPYFIFRSSNQKETGKIIQMK